MSRHRDNPEQPKTPCGFAPSLAGLDNDCALDMAESVETKMEARRSKCESAAGCKLSFACLLDKLRAEYASLEARLEAVRVENAALKSGMSRNVEGSYRGDFEDRAPSPKISQVGCGLNAWPDCNDIANSATASAATRTSRAKYTTSETPWLRFVNGVLHSTTYRLYTCWQGPEETRHSFSRLSIGTDTEVHIQIAGQPILRNGYNAVLFSYLIQISVGKGNQGQSHSMYFGGGLMSSGRAILGWSNISKYVDQLVMHPSCQRRLAWICLSVLMLSIDIVTFSIEPFTKGAGAVLHVMHMSSTVFWTLDIILSFWTAFYNDGSLETRIAQIARHYACTWLIFDLLCTTPFWIDIFYSGTEGLSLVVRILRIFRYIRFLRFVKLKQFYQAITNSIDSTSLLLGVRCVKEVIFLVAFIHLSACMCFLLGDREEGWAARERYTDKQPTYMYVESCYWAVAQLQGSTDVQLGTTLVERIFAVATIILSVFFLARLVSKMTNIMIELHELEKRYSQMKVMRSYFSRNRISDDIRERMRMYIVGVQRDVAVQKQAEEEKTVLLLLPTSLKRQVIGETRATHIERNPCFNWIQSSCPRCFERLCCDSIQSLFIHPQETIFNFGDRCHHIYFIADGRVVYLTYSKIIKYLEQADISQKASRHSQTSRASPRGGWRRRSDTDTAKPDAPGASDTPVEKYSAVAEPTLWTHWLHKGDCCSLSHSSLLKLSSLDFLDVVTSYFSAHDGLKKHAELFVAMLNDGDGHSNGDLFDSALMMKIMIDKSPKEFHKLARQLRRRAKDTTHA